MRYHKYVLFGLCLSQVIWLSAPVHADWEIKTAKLKYAPDEIVLRKRGRGLSKIRIKSRGTWLALTVCGGAICSSFSKTALKRDVVPRGGLADGRVGRGKNDIRAAWLARPTRRYSHNILGDAIEAGGLTVVDRLNRTHHFPLPLDEVFEDRYARVVDLDGDKSDEIVVILSSRIKGVSLVVLKLTGEGIAKVAQTKPLGRKGDWLNPAGIGDFDGDGRTEIAIVTNPGRYGRLELWEYHKGQLVFERSLVGFSNHLDGSKVLNMSAQADFDGDGKVDLVLPGVDRSQLRIISFAGGMVAEPAYIKLPGRVVTEIVSVVVDGKPAIVAGLDTGIVVLVTNGASVLEDDIPNWYKKNNETSLLQDMVNRNRRRTADEKMRRRNQYGKPNFD